MHVAIVEGCSTSFSTNECMWSNSSKKFYYCWDECENSSISLLEEYRATLTDSGSSSIDKNEEWCKLVQGFVLKNNSLSDSNVESVFINLHEILIRENKILTFYYADWAYSLSLDMITHSNVNLN